jgi:hypothetical protein
MKVIKKSKLNNIPWKILNWFLSKFNIVKTVIYIHGVLDTIKININNISKKLNPMPPPSSLMLKY